MTARRKCCEGLDPECDGVVACAASGWAEVERLSAINVELVNTHNAMNRVAARWDDERTDLWSEIAFLKQQSVADSVAGDVPQ